MVTRFTGSGGIMKLISNWRKAHKMSSMQLNAIALTCDGVFIGLAVWYESFPMPVLLYADPLS